MAKGKGKKTDTAQATGAGDVLDVLDRLSGPEYESTSGLMLTEYDSGSIRMEFVDYGVGRFGGGDYESWYTFDKENAQKLREALGKLYTGTLKQQAVAAFGKNFDVPKLNEFCSKHGIKYYHDSWTSYDDDDD